MQTIGFTANAEREEMEKLARALVACAREAQIAYGLSDADLQAGTFEALCRLAGDLSRGPWGLGQFDKPTIQEAG